MLNNISDNSAQNKKYDLEERTAKFGEDIIEFCRKYLSRYKIPKYIYRYHELPKTAIGKTARRILRKEINQL